jgi:hypothetical protein
MKNTNLLKSMGGGAALLLGFALNTQAITVDDPAVNITSASSSEITYLDGATPLAGGSLTSTLVGNPNSGAGPYPAGTLSSWVFAAGGGSSGDIFVYQLSLNGDFANTLTLFSGFPQAAGSSLGVFYDNTSLSVGLAPSAGAPDGTTAASDNQISAGAVSSGTLTFTFDPYQATSINSVYLIVNTSSAFFGTQNAGVQDDGQSDAPYLAPVPEPATIMSGALLLLPFGASTLRILRKNRTTVV